MSPKRATSYIKAFELPEDEEYFLLHCDVKKESVCKASSNFGLTIDSGKKIRQRAYAHIADDLKHSRTG